MPTLETRRAVLDGITEREIVIRVAPYGDTGDLGGGIKERFKPGAFGIPTESIALKLETAAGHSGPVVGVATDWEERSDGLFGTFKIAETTDGDDALELAGMGALGASAGFMLDPVNVTRSKSDGAMEIGSADLREVTLTATPAYATAGPVEVRSTNEGNQTMDQVEETTPTPDVDVDALITAAVEKAVDETRSAIVATSAELPAVEAEHRGHDYRSVGEVLVDMNRHARQLDPEATERLTRSIDSGMVSRDGSTFQIREFAKNPPEVPNSVGFGIAEVNNAFMDDLLLLLREGRPAADLFNSRPLPALGNGVEFPSVDVGNTVDYQDGQGIEVDRTDQTQVVVTFPKATIAGGQPLSIQAQRWTQPAYFDAVAGDLAAAYTEFLDSTVINGDPAVDTPTSGTGHTGMLNAPGLSTIPGGLTVLTALAVFGEAWAAVYQGSRRSPIAALMNSTLWGEFLDEVDSDGRPIVTTDFPQNPAGIGNAASVSGSIRSIPVVVDENVPADTIIVGSWRDAMLLEDATPATISLTFPDTLSTDVSIFGFSTLAIRRGGAFAAIEIG